MQILISKNSTTNPNSEITGQNLSNPQCDCLLRFINLSVLCDEGFEVQIFGRKQPIGFVAISCAIQHGLTFEFLDIICAIQHGLSLESSEKKTHQLKLNQVLSK